MKNPRLSLLLIFTVLSAIRAYSQGTAIPLNSDDYHLMDRFNIQFAKALPVFCTAVKPFSRKKVAEYSQAVIKENITGDKRFKQNISYEYIENSEWLEDTIIKSKRPLWRIIYPEPASFFAVNTEGFILKINPVLHFQFGAQVNGGEFKFFNTRGVELRGYIKKKIGFYTYFADNQQRNMQYVQDLIPSEPQAVPGEGFYKDGFRETGVDYFTARGYVVVNALGHIDITFGHDKNFYGNGIRSLFLSDYSNNYFFLKLNTTIWKITYTNLFTELTATYKRGPDQLLPKKYAAFHHLNFSATYWLDIGLFEGVIFQRDNGFELQYLNPIIFYRAIEQALGSPDNALIGLDYKSNIARTLQVYGQFLIDEFNFEHIKAHDGWWANKIGIQTGLKYINMFGISHLDFQTEFNWVRPYMYTHSDSGTTYTNYNQPLAHPLGANFWELLFKINGQITPKMCARAMIMYAVKGTGTDENGHDWGGNIFLVGNSSTVQSELGNEVTQGIKDKITIFDLLLSYQLEHHLYFDLNMVIRSLKSDIASQDNTQTYFGFAIRLNIPYRGYWF